MSRGKISLLLPKIAIRHRYTYKSYFVDASYIFRLGQYKLVPMLRCRMKILGPLAKHIDNLLLTLINIGFNNFVFYSTTAEPHLPIFFYFNLENYGCLKDKSIYVYMPTIINETE